MSYALTKRHLTGSVLVGGSEQMMLQQMVDSFKRARKGLFVPIAGLKQESGRYGR
jgi:hypothetical protein